MRTDNSAEFLALHFGAYSNEILMSEGMQYEKMLPHQGEVTCYDHSVSVAWLSTRLAEHFHFNVDMKSLVRGALLHDYYLYDWHAANDLQEAGRALHRSRRRERFARHARTAHP